MGDATGGLRNRVRHLEALAMDLRAYIVASESPSAHVLDFVERIDRVLAREDSVTAAVLGERECPKCGYDFKPPPEMTPAEETRAWRDWAATNCKTLEEYEAECGIRRRIEGEHMATIARLTEERDEARSDQLDAIQEASYAEEAAASARAETERLRAEKRTRGEDENAAIVTLNYELADAQNEVTRLTQERNEARAVANDQARKHWAATHPHDPGYYGPSSAPALPFPAEAAEWTEYDSAGYPQRKTRHDPR